jgi:hypothetical protein
MTPLFLYGINANLCNSYAYVLQNQLVTIGTAGTTATFVNCSGPNGYIPPAGARVRVPNIYCGSVLQTAPATLNYTLGPYQQAHYGAFYSQRYTIYSTKVQFNISNTVLIWSINASSPTPDTFIIRDSAIAEGLMVTDVINEVTLNNIGISFVTTSASILNSPGITPLTITRCTGASIIDCAISTTIGGNMVTLSYCSGSTIRNCRTSCFGGSGAQIFDKNTLFNITCSMCHDLTINNISVIGQGCNFTYCNNLYIDGYIYANQLAGATNSINTSSGITISNCISVLLKGFGLYGNLDDIAPYVSLVTLVKCNDVYFIDWGTPNAPLRLCSLGTNVSTNSAPTNIFVLTNSEMIDNFYVRRVYLKGGRGYTNIISTSVANQIRNCEYTNVWAHETTTASISLALAADNIIARGCFASVMETISISGIRDSIFYDYFKTSTTGIMAIMCNPPVKYASYVTLSGNASFSGDGDLTLMNLDDACVWEWPFFVLGITSFSAATAIVYAPTTITAGVTFNFQYDKTGGGYNGDWIAMTASNLNSYVGAITPSIGVRLKIQAICSLPSTRAINNTFQTISIATVTDAASRATQYTTSGLVPLTSTSAAHLAGRVTGSIYNVGRTKTQVSTTVVSTSDTGAAASYEWQQSLDAVTGNEIMVRVKYSSTAMPLYPRIGDQFNL